MAYTTAEGRERILEDLGAAADRIGLALACLSEAYELVDEAMADRLEDELFGPVQTAYGLAKRTHAGFAARAGLPSRSFESPSAGGASQGAQALIERTVDATSAAAQEIAELQDSMLPVEVGDPELRAGLSEIRGLLDPVAAAARELVRTLGR